MCSDRSHGRQLQFPSVGPRPGPDLGGGLLCCMVWSLSGHGPTVQKVSGQWPRGCMLSVHIETFKHFISANCYIDE